MEILRAKVEVNSSTKLPASAESQFVVMRAVEPGIKTVTITMEDPVLARKLFDRKQLTIILEDER
jgi:hypothetical protein